MQAHMAAIAESPSRASVRGLLDGRRPAIRSIGFLPVRSLNHRLDALRFPEEESCCRSRPTGKGRHAPAGGVTSVGAGLPLPKPCD